MKLKEFNSHNSMAIKKGNSIIGFNLNSGRIRINLETIELMKLVPGKEVVFFQDEETPKDWYIAIKEGGLPVREALDKNSFAVYSRAICKIIADSCEIPISSWRMNIAKEPIDVDGINCFPIITGSWK